MATMTTKDGTQIYYKDWGSSCTEPTIRLFLSTPLRYSSKIVKGAILKLYDGVPHGVAST